jgi:hypothetical protein
MEELELGQFFGFDDDFVRAGFTPYRGGASSTTK